MRRAVFVVLVACSTSTNPSPSVDAALAPPQPLGMNDVSVLLPLPADLATPVVTTLDGAGTPLVDRDWFDALVVNNRDIGVKDSSIRFDWPDFQLVALRVDLCDRSTVGPCPTGVDGRLRLVFQPLFDDGGTTSAYDAGVHLFYPIPAADLPAVVAELRALAQIQAATLGTPLGVSPAAIAGNATYLTRLRALVLRYATWTNLVRLTVNGQESPSGAFAWVFRGLEGTNDVFTPMLIPEVLSPQQTTLVAGGNVIYTTAPIFDAPAGFALATDGSDFAAATSAQQLEALGALVQIMNPQVRDAVDTQCVACHIATYLTTKRAAALAVDPATIVGGLVTPYNTSVNTILNVDPRVVRAFGWIGAQPAISQRVANDTAEVLTEIEAQFPAQ